MAFVDDFLEHYGTKGMKWGVRKKSKPRPAFMPPVKSGSGKPKWQSPPAKKVATPTPSAPRKVKPTLLPFQKKKTPKVLSEEAQQFRDIRAKAKRDGVSALSNKELELINKRLELQSKYNKAFPKKKNPFVEVAIDGILSDYGTKTVVKLVKDKNPVMGLAVEAALELNKQSRKGNSSKNK